MKFFCLKIFSNSKFKEYQKILRLKTSEGRIVPFLNTFVARASVELSLGSPHFGLKTMEGCQLIEKKNRLKFKIKENLLAHIPADGKYQMFGSVLKLAFLEKLLF